MTTPSYSTKKRLVVIFFSVTIIVFVLVIRLGFWQIVRGEDLKKEALEQWTKGIEIKAKRGVIYDKNGKKLAMSISAYTVWARPADIKEPEKTAKLVADILNLDEKTVYDKITKNQRTEKIKQWISNDEATKLRQSLVKDKITGIEIIDDNKRYYPYGNFASYILGFTNIDNDGLYGIEKTYDKFLKGTPGKWVKTTDVAGRQLPFGGEKIFDAKDGLSVVLTIDETIQHFAEKAATEALVQNKAKNVSVIIMEPKTGDILAMATKPDYDPNEPREPLNEEEKKEWDNLSQEELQKKWYDMWRNFSINDAYEPTDPSQARGTITESVGADNKEYPRRSGIADVLDEASGGQMKERPKADAREYLTFQTKSGKVFHLIINHDEPDSNVQLLTEVSEQDLLNMIEQDEERNGIAKVEEEPKKEVVKKEEPEKEEPEKEDSKGSFLIVLLIVAVVGGAGYYFKVVKANEDGFDDFEDDEIPNDDDFFSSSDEEESNEEVEDEDTEYTKEDLI